MPWPKGKKQSEAIRQKRRDSMIKTLSANGGLPKNIKKFNKAGKNTRYQKGKVANEDHPQWLGENASYFAIHVWINRHFKKPLKCENCGYIVKLQWAHKSGNETRREEIKYSRNRDDYLALCSKCHFEYDNIGLKMREYYGRI